jgi:hypothetical protein
MATGAFQMIPIQYQWVGRCIVAPGLGEGGPEPGHGQSEMRY